MTLPEPFHRWRENVLLAHVLPFAVFMGFTELPGLFKIENAELPWYTFSPEQWIYPLQTLVVGVLLLFFWKHYHLGPWKGSGLGVVLGALGIVFWIVPSLVFERLGVVDWPAPNLSIPLVVDDAPAWELLGLGPRLEGFDPSFFREHTFYYWSAVALRFLRMVVVVALIEEIFWRSFLQRYLIDSNKCFTEIPFGTHSWKAFFGTTLAFTLVHAHIDWLACLVYGSLTYWLSIRTKSLAACIVMHGVANLLLGLYTLRTEQWGFW